MKFLFRKTKQNTVQYKVQQYIKQYSIHTTYNVSLNNSLSIDPDEERKCLHFVPESCAPNSKVTVPMDFLF